VKKQQAATTFEVLARAWHKQKTRSWSVGHARNVLSSMVDEAFPKIGHLPITKIQPAHILEVLRPMEQRGAVDQAHRLRQRMSDVFVLAISSGLAESDPAAIVRKALQPIIKRNYPALTSIEEARALLEADAQLKGWPITKLASRLLAITAARSEALRYAEPHEFEDLDGLSPLWRVPAAKMKLGVEQRKQVALEFIIPLPRQAVEIVKLAKQLTSPGRRREIAQEWADLLCEGITPIKGLLELPRN